MSDTCYCFGGLTGADFNGQSVLGDFAYELGPAYDDVRSHAGLIAMQQRNKYELVCAYVQSIKAAKSLSSASFVR
jgi:hypothetical protein